MKILKISQKFDVRQAGLYLNWKSSTLPIYGRLEFNNTISTGDQRIVDKIAVDEPNKFGRNDLFLLKLQPLLVRW